MTELPRWVALVSIWASALPWTTAFCVGIADPAVSLCTLVPIADLLMATLQIAQLREAITTIADGVHGTRKPMKVSNCPPKQTIHA